MLGDHLINIDKFDSLMKIMDDYLIDSNVFFRSLVLTVNNLRCKAAMNEAVVLFQTYLESTHLKRLKALMTVIDLNTITQERFTQLIGSSTASNTKSNSRQTSTSS